MPISFYKCKYCFRTYNYRKDATKCEKSHPYIVKAKAVEYMHRDVHPLIVEVEFDNGDKRMYISKDDV